MARRPTLGGRAPGKNVRRLLGAAKAGAKQVRTIGELADASAQTIALRLRIFDKATGFTKGVSDPEFARMSNEKIAVASEAGIAMIGKLAELNRIFLDFWFRQVQRS